MDNNCKFARMSFMWAFLLLSIYNLFIVEATCPVSCSCKHDDIGRKTVTCDIEKLGTGIPVFDMDRDTKVLTITSEEEQPTVLTVGPVFSQLSQLEEVHITRANVPSIGENTFWGLRHLRLLNLTNNNITLLLDSHLNGIRSLQALHLDNNIIDTVASATFMSLEKLEILTLAGNRLNALSPRMFYLLSNLKTLDLSGNPIRDLDPEIFKDIPRLRTFRCTRCLISRVRSLVYKVIPTLETLDLSGNEINFLSSEEFSDLKYLKYLYLDENRIYELEDYTFKDLGLFHLSLSNNRMEKISKMAFEDCSIMALDLSGNYLGYSSLRHLNPIISHIHDLDISGMHIGVRHLQDLIRHATRLKKLSISGIRLTHLPPDIFAFHSRIQSLNVSENSLKFIPVDILHSLPSLHSLDLQRNQFKGLPDIILRRLDRIKDVYLQYNPWSCDQCHIPQMKVWLNKSVAFRDACRPNVDHPNCLKCQAPIEMYDKPIIEVEGLQLQPCPEGTFDVAAASEGNSGFSLILAIATATVVMVLLIIILIVGIVMYNRHSAFYYTHENDSRHHFYDNPAITSNHTDVTLAEDLDHMPDIGTDHQEACAQSRCAEEHERDVISLPNEEEATEKQTKKRGALIKIEKYGGKQKKLQKQS